MTTDRHDDPKVTLMLPGEWISARPDDPGAVEKFQTLAADQAPAIQSLFQQAAAGAVLLMFRIRSSPPVLLTVIWPRGQGPGQPTIDSTRQRLGIQGIEIEHTLGYPCIRRRESSDQPFTDTLTYGLTHPDTGRLLVVQVVAFEESLSDLDVSDYDFTLGQLSWDET